jgi:hypothetical protein
VPEWLAGQGFSILGFVTLLITSGIVVQLIRVGPERRQINAQAVTEGAQAASLLTAQAVAMVERAQSDATQRVKEAVDNANVRVAAEVERRKEAEERARVEDTAHRVCEEENLALTRELTRVVRRLAQWEDWAVDGAPPPSEKRRSYGDAAG